VGLPNKIHWGFPGYLPACLGSG